MAKEDRSLVEAQKRVITLHDDHPDAVDLMLLYLYTLEVPNLERTGDAEKCMLLGDKYDLPALHDGGRKAIESSIQRNVPRWHALTDLGKRQWVDFFERVWSWQIKNAIGIRTLLFAYLASVADILIEDTLFQDLLWENRGFNLAFVKAVIKEAKG
ncbi:hypothetical protein PMZ80_005437 [Knufia obscura]|uniref:Uncharacterized protein n=1 Tax=Knufia obscura TaxID=1635080 RepID=A0ABR0RQK1_9EURO|nr:hypothetical protein PMZ80_005437 [Knufia obscura]